jgi:hypothetical protein
MDWTLFEFIETMTNAATFAGAKLTQLMMHEECGAAQNYVVAGAGEVLICRAGRDEGKDNRKGNARRLGEVPW